MYLPSLGNTPQARESITEFLGLCQTNECSPNEMRSMHNMSLKDFPYLSTRRRRSTLSTSFTDIKGILGGESLYIASTDAITKIDRDGTVTKTATTLTNTKKTLVKMGAYVCIFPDKKVYKSGTVSDMEVTNSATSVTFSLTNGKGEAITYHTPSYYDDHDPQDGDYLLTEVNGTNELQQYSSTSGTWFVVTTAYVMATATGIGANLNAFDGVKISLDLGSNTWDEVSKVFPNSDGNVHYATYPIKSVSANSVTFSGLISATKVLTSVVFKVERKTPDIAYVTEAMNRLWACNSTGTEIYATKLGDPYNWNCFEGISTDSWAVTIGSDGEFTGAVTYLGYPTFFKENSLIKIAISSTGAHQTKETVCRGVQKGCGDSLTVVNEILYYKSQTAICAYDGSLPQTISKKLGDMTPFNTAIGGRNKEAYYVQCGNNTEKHIYVYDTQRGIWAEDDNTPYDCMTTWINVLVGAKNAKIDLFDEHYVTGTAEDPFKWFIETNTMDYQTPDAKYVHRIVVKAELKVKSRATVWISYDDGMYQRLFEMRSMGTRTYPLTIIPRRCDRFKIKIEGIGDIKIYSITKALETGSDV